MKRKIISFVPNILSYKNKKEGKMNKKSFIGLLGMVFLVLTMCLLLPAAAYSAGKLGVNVASPNYFLDVSSAGSPISQLHFSLDGSDTGGWLTSVKENNFFISSGAMWDSTIPGWIQKSSDSQTVIAGSGTAGFRVLTRTGCAVGTACPIVTRMVVDYNGNVGFGMMNASHPLHMAGGAYCTGTQWINASSRDYKENIKELSTEEALVTFNKLDPVTFTYKSENNGQQHVGFIAEEVPDLVATPDRKGLSAMDIAAVLTRVVQQQNKMISELTEKVKRLEEKLK